MSLLFPLGLLGLISLPIIFILHLRFERSKQFLVSSLELWSFLEVQMSGPRSRNVRVTWLLLLDLLIAGVITLALARPILDFPSPFAEPRNVVILLDDSSSMLAMEGSETRFDLVRAEIIVLLNQLSSRDRVLLITVGTQADIVWDTSDNGFLGLEDAMQSLFAGGVGVEIRAGIGAAHLRQTGDSQQEIHFFTDAAFSGEEIFGDFPDIEWHLVGSEENNQAVISLEVFQVSANQTQVFAQFANYSDVAVTREYRMLLDDAVVVQQSIELLPDSVGSQIWNITGGGNLLSLEFMDRDVLREDDIAYWVRPTEGEVDVLLVTEVPGRVADAFLAAPSANLSIISSDDYLPGLDFDLFVFENFIPDVIPMGTTLILNPPLENSVFPLIGRYEINGLLEISAHLITEELSFAGLRWGDIWVLADPEVLELIPIITLGETPILGLISGERSEQILFLAQLEDGNLLNHPFFPVLISNIVKYAAHLDLPNQIEIGDSVDIQSEIYPRISVITPLGNSIEISDQFSDSQTPGIYQVTMEDYSQVEREYYFAVNAGELNESEIAPNQEVVAEIPLPSEDRSERIGYFEITPLLLGLVCLLLIIEARIVWK